MTLKMIAIGILALMGLSSVMSPKTFRRFMGGLGALCMAIFIGLLATGNHDKDQPSMFRTLISKASKVAGLRPEWWIESATEQSQRIANEIREGRTGDPQLKDLVPNVNSAPNTFAQKKHLLLLRTPIPANQENTVESIREGIDRYLDYYRSQRKDIGVDRLTHRNLDPHLVRWTTPDIPGGLQDKNGNTVFFLGFDEAYDEHIREQGRKLVVKERLAPMAQLGIAFGAFLFLSYAALKIVNRRAEPIQDDQDYLQNSNISMV